ncbi:MAG: DUF47 domain-containing protein [Candidatus Methanofastidiosia archaeon]
MIFGKKEDDVLEALDEHMHLVEKCLNTFSRGMESYLKEDLQACANVRKNIVEYEHKADIKRREVQMKLYEGAFMPLYRDDIYSFMDALDDVADTTKNLMNTIVLEKPLIPRFLVSEFLELAENTIAPFVNLKKAIASFKSDRKNILAEAEEVEKKEHLVDKIEYMVRKKIFESELHLSEKMALRDFAMNVANISDKIEDCSNLLEIMAVKRQL